jgi:hypothetical protein
MTIRERRDNWLAERRMIRMLLAREPSISKAQLGDFRNDARAAEQFIRYYEARIAREAA